MYSRSSARIGTGTPPHSEHSTRPRAPQPLVSSHERNAAPAIERSILLAVLYADIFDFPLTSEELYEQLVGAAPSRAAFERALSAVTGPFLSCTSGYITWCGRESLVAIRERRQKAAGPLWEAAHRYAGWLGRIPFVRMVAVSGSLAIENAEADSDIDLFCVTSPGRLWIVRLFLVPLSKMTRLFSTRFPHYLCPNYVLAGDSLSIEHHDLYTAHEVVHVRLIWGAPVYRRFRKTNAWTGAFLPGAVRTAAPESPEAPPRPRLTRLLERLLAGSFGDRCDAAIFAAFSSCYRYRAGRRGWSWEHLSSAYRRSRYTVPEGGYAGVIGRRFAARVRERLGDEVPGLDMEQLVGAPHPADATCYDWETLFRREYGPAPEDGADR